MQLAKACIALSLRTSLRPAACTTQPHAEITYRIQTTGKANIPSHTNTLLAALPQRGRPHRSCTLSHMPHSGASASSLWQPQRHVTVSDNNKTTAAGGFRAPNEPYKPCYPLSIERAVQYSVGSVSSNALGTTACEAVARGSGAYSLLAMLLSPPRHHLTTTTLIGAPHSFVVSQLRTLQPLVLCTCTNCYVPRPARNTTTRSPCCCSTYR